MSDPKAVLKLSASSISNWLTCPAKIKFKEKLASQGGGDVHIGTIIGNMVHAMVTGHEYKEKDNLIIFDSQTPTMTEAERQAERMADSVQSFIQRHEIEIIASEREIFRKINYNNVEVNLFGKIDLLCKKDDEVMIIDLKTGVNKPSNVFVQLATYSYICSMGNELDVDSVGVIWVKRAKDPCIELVQKVMCSAVDTVASSAIKQIVLMKIADVYPYSPNMMNCSSCPHKKCPARVGDRIIEI